LVAGLLFRTAAAASFALTAAAQNQPVAGVATLDSAWFGLTQSAAAAAAAPLASAAERAAARDTCTDLAGQARDFVARNPQSGSAPRAQQLESLLLIRAAELGDTANGSRLAALVGTVRNDPRLPEHERFVVASRANELAIELTPKLDHVARLAAFERSARQMIAEFPDLAEPYEALMALAEDVPDAAAGAAMAAELAGMNSPEGVKAQARTLVERVALAGQSLGGQMSDEQGVAYQLNQARTKPLVVYTWSAASPASVAMARWLSEQVGDKATLLGVNLDANPASARALLSRTGITTPQCYSLLGAGSDCARQIRLTRPGLIYLFDRKGVLRDVRGERNARQKLTVLLAGGAS
jgi:hypothetical protein